MKKIVSYNTFVNEMLDPLGKWTMDDAPNDNPYDGIYNKFTSWLCGEKDFDFYDGEPDFRNKFIEISNTTLPAEEKASKIANYLEEKWGLHDGYQEVVDYLEKLYFDEV